LRETCSPAFGSGIPSWNDTGGKVSKFTFISLVYDAVNRVLYAGTDGHGVWRYDGSVWTSTGGGISSNDIVSLAFGTCPLLLLFDNVFLR